ncbi:hypothetical protein CsatB_019212 [Cannabis sativa]
MMRRLDWLGLKIHLPDSSTARTIPCKNLSSWTLLNCPDFLCCEESTFLFKAWQCIQTNRIIITRAKQNVVLVIRFFFFFCITSLRRECYPIKCKNTLKQTYHYILLLLL